MDELDEWNNTIQFIINKYKDKYNIQKLLKEKNYTQIENIIEQNNNPRLRKAVLYFFLNYNDIVENLEHLDILLKFDPDIINGNIINQDAYDEHLDEKIIIPVPEFLLKYFIKNIIKIENFDLLKSLIKKYSIKLNFKDGNLFLEKNLSIFLNKYFPVLEDFIKFLISNGINLKQRNSYGQTPLMMLCRSIALFKSKDPEMFNNIFLEILDKDPSLIKDIFDFNCVKNNGRIPNLSLPNHRLVWILEVVRF